MGLSHSMPKASKAIISTKEETPYGMKRSGMECGEFHLLAIFTFLLRYGNKGVSFGILNIIL